MSTRIGLLSGGFTLLVLLSGCLGGGAIQTPTHQTPVDSPERGECARWVSFYGLDGPAQRTWAPDRVSIGYTVPPGASVFFVAEANGSIIGSTHVSTDDLDHGVTADGDGIQLEEPLHGSHVVRVTTYSDVNGNEDFDTGIDEPCRFDGELVQTDQQRINFTRFESPPPSPSPSEASPTPTESG